MIPVQEKEFLGTIINSKEMGSLPLEKLGTIKLMCQHLYQNPKTTVLQFFKHFANKNQLPSLSVSGTLVESGLSKELRIELLW